MIQAVVFDLDGVLVDADEWHFDALNLALKDHDFPEITAEEHATIYKGIPTAKKLEVYAERHDLGRPVPKTVAYGKQFWTRQFIEWKCKPVPVIQQTLAEAAKQGRRIAVASNAIRESVERMLQLSGLLEYVELILSNEDVDAPKPAPDIYFKAFRALLVNPEDALIVEDSEVGKQAAYASGAWVCEVADPSQVNWPRVYGCIKRAERISVVIPAAGSGKRFAEAGYLLPKPLIDVNGEPMLQRVIDNFEGVTRHPIVIAQKSHLDQYAMASLFPDVSFVQTQGLTRGAAETVLTARRYFADSHELVLANSDQLVYAAPSYSASPADTRTLITRMIDYARLRRWDGCIMVFESDGDPKWSYASVDQTLRNGEVVEVAEKRPLPGNLATVGIYYFRRGSDFAWAADAMIRKDIRTNGEFYVAPVYNELIQEGRTIGVYPITQDEMKALGTPEDLEAYLACASRS